MHSWKEEFGSFIINDPDWKANKEIIICIDDKMTGEDMVTTAIKFCKRFNCSIAEQVKYIPDSWGGGKVTFHVKCHRLTYRGLYEDGNKKEMGPAHPNVSSKDIEKYIQSFGISECLHEDFKKDFYFKDNWNGEILHFPSLKKAQKAAVRQTGNVIYIYENFPYGRPPRIAKVAEASGITPP